METKNEQILVSRMKDILKKAIDEHSCKEPLDVGFRRGVEWYVFESGITVIDEMKKCIADLEAENKALKEALQRQVST